MLTKEEIAVVMPLLDAGVRATGLQVFQQGAAAALQSAFIKLQAMADKSEEQDS